MKRWKKILALLLCLCFVQAPLASVSMPIVAEAAAKSGLKKESGKYYYYSAGKKIKNKWKTIKSTENGKTVKYRYYFGSNGAAYAGRVIGDGILVPTVKKISGKYYGFDQYGHMLKGLYVKNGKFYVFDSNTGVCDQTLSRKLRAAAKEGTQSSTLISLLKKQVGKPIKKQTGLASCYGDGTDQIYSYSGFDVQLFKDRKTKKVTVVSVVASALPKTTQKQTEAEKETEKEASGTEAAANQENTKTVSVLKKVNGKYYYYDKNGKPIKKTWKNIKSAENGKTVTYRYYFKEDGSAQTYSAKINGKLYVYDTKGRLAKGTESRFVTVGKKRYYVDKNGIASTGWLIIDRALYYANSKGVLKTGVTTSEGIVFDSKGKAKKNTASDLKITVMEIVNSITKSSMNKAQKLQACWNYVVAGNHFSYYGRYPDLEKKGWQQKEALDMLTTRAGNCYGFACAFAALAGEIGYDPYVVAGRVSGTRDQAADGLTRHAWVMIGGRYYDPEAQFKGWYPGVYGLSAYSVAHKVQYTVNFKKSI